MGQIMNNGQRIKIISRQKLNGLGKHYGVYLGDDKCFDLQPFGIRQISLEEFSSGYRIKIEHEVPLTKEIYRRVTRIASMKIRYSLFMFNCESFARYMVTGKAESRQVKYLAASSFGAGLCYYLLSSPLNAYLF